MGWGKGNRKKASRAASLSSSGISPAQRRRNEEQAKKDALRRADMRTLVETAVITTTHRLKLEVVGQTVTLSGPPCNHGFDNPYSRATLGSSRLRMRPPIYEQPDDVPWSGELGIGSWRHKVRGLFHEFNHTKTYYAEEKPELLGEELVIEYQGKDYRGGDHDSFPVMPDFIHDIGSFNMTSSDMLAIDPCYDDLQNGVKLQNVLLGKWNAKALYQDDVEFFGAGWRPGILAVFHESISDQSIFDLDWYQENVGNAGVDSGQCGFFDQVQYPVTEKEHESNDGTFYNRACIATRDRESSYDDDSTKEHDCGILESGEGVNSATFYGDGGYSVKTYRNQAGELVAACLVFNTNLEQHDDDQQDYDEGDDETDTYNDQVGNGTIVL